MTTPEARAIYRAEKAAYIARNGTDGVALMPKRKPNKRENLNLKRAERTAKRKERVNELRAYHRAWYAKNREARCAQARAAYERKKERAS